MIIYSRQDQYEFEFPLSFIPQLIKDKYEPYLNNLESPINDARDFLNHTIQVISIPGISYTPEVQNQTGNEIAFRSSKPYNTLIDKEFEITFQMTSGFINYMILWEAFLYHYAFDNGNLHIDPFRLYFVDTDGVKISSILLSQILFTGLNRIEADMTNDTQEPFQFTATFTFNKIDFEVLEEDVIDNPEENTPEWMYDNNFDLNITSYFNDNAETGQTGYRDFGISLLNSLNCRAHSLTNEKISINFVRADEVIFPVYGGADELISQLDIQAAMAFEIVLDPNKTYLQLSGQYKDSFTLEVTLIDFCGNKRQIINIDNNGTFPPTP